MSRHMSDPRDWRARATCRDVDPELFFPAAENGDAYETARAAATAVCAGCPVLAQCRDWALVALPYGIAGGLDEHERRALARQGGARRIGGAA